MAAESRPFSFLQHFHDHLSNHNQQQTEAVHLDCAEFDEFQDFYHSDSEQSADAGLLLPHFSVDYGDDDFSDASDLVDNVAVDDPWDVNSGGDVLDRENQVIFVRNLFQDRVENHDFGLVDESNYFDLGVELGLGLNFGDGDDDDALFGSWRMDGGVRLFGSRLGSREEAGHDHDESELCSEEEDEFGLEYCGTIDDASENLCWDSLQLEDQTEDDDDDEELEWEEVGESGVEDLEGNVLTMVLGGEVDDVVDSVLQLRNDEVVPERVVTGWEVLLNAENVGVQNVEVGNEDQYFGPEGYFYADEYETIFGQFAENEGGVMGKPPAAKSSVENLETVVMQVDVESSTSICAVCKDDMQVGEKAKRLPCSHSYHGECIIPWLSIRNTCPVCRFELPTDDPAYERWKTQRASGGN